ncbi:MAG: phage major capsid protein [Gemmatimonadaceae bacterium]|jgi:hypothetical protein
MATNNLTINAFAELAATTMDAVQASGKVHDQVYDEVDPLWAVMNKGKNKTTEKGGDNIRLHIRRAKLGTASSYSGWDQGSMSPTDTLGYVLLPWAQYRIPVAIDNATILKNRGKAAWVKLLADKVDEAGSDIRDLMCGTAHGIYGDGTGNSSKDLTGLGAIITTTGTYAGVNRSTSGNEFWQAGFVTSKSSASVTSAMIRTGINDCRGVSSNGQKTGRGDLIIMPQDVYESFCDLYEDKVRMQSDLKVAQLGFEAIKYNGAEIIFTSKQTANQVTFLSTSTLGFSVMESRDFAWTRFEDTTINGQDGQVAWLHWMGNMTCNEPRRNGRYTSVAT